MFTLAIVQPPTWQQACWFADIADRLHATLIPEKLAHFDFILFYEKDMWRLAANCFAGSLPLTINFLEGDYAKRARALTSRNELLARAAGVTKTYRPTVYDVTAGFGADAFVLASLGCSMTLIERNGVIAWLLQDALWRWQQTVPYILPIKCQWADSRDYLQHLTDDHYPDVVYLDPMYPTRHKHALPSLPLQVARLLVGDDPDAEQLFTIACQRAKKRVVVKRPITAKPLALHKPDLTFAANKHRFDVYLI